MPFDPSGCTRRHAGCGQWGNDFLWDPLRRSRPPPVLLPGDPEAEAALLAGENATIVAAARPVGLGGLGCAGRGGPRDDDKAITAYAYARTGYHRGLDQLRRNGWKGFGPVPFRHEPNRGFLRCVAALARAADLIGETDEVARCRDLLDDCDPAARAELGVGLEVGFGRAVRDHSRRLHLDGAVVEAAFGQDRLRVGQHPVGLPVGGQMRGGHVRYQRPDVKVVHLGDAVDGGQCCPQLVDVDVFGGGLREDPQCRPRQGDGPRQHPQGDQHGYHGVGIGPVRRHHHDAGDQHPDAADGVGLSLPCRRP